MAVIQTGGGCKVLRSKGKACTIVHCMDGVVIQKMVRPLQVWKVRFVTIDYLKKHNFSFI